MATEQIKIAQVATSSGTPSSTTYLRGDGTWNTPAAGGAMETKLITLSGGATDKTTAAFGFVVGPVLIEVTAGSDDATDVYATLWVNMRSFSGTKTANVTNRKARGCTGGTTCHCFVDRTTSGTVLVLSQIDQGADFEADGTSIGSLNLKNWPNPGRLRITAWEDTQA